MPSRLNVENWRFSAPLAGYYWAGPSSTSALPVSGQQVYIATAQVLLSSFTQKAWQEVLIMVPCISGSCPLYAGQSPYCVGYPRPRPPLPDKQLGFQFNDDKG